MHLRHTSLCLCHDLVRQVLFAPRFREFKELAQGHTANVGKLGPEPTHVAVIQTVKDDHTGYHIWREFFQKNS